MTIPSAREPHDINGALDYLIKHPFRSEETSWSGWAGSLMYNVGHFPHFYLNVHAARSYAGPLNSRMKDAPVGASHYFNSPSGQVGLDIVGGGRFLAATSNLPMIIRFGPSTGLVMGSIMAGQMAYYGWSMSYGHVENTLKPIDEWNTAW